MSLRVIPEKREVICDACGVVCTQLNRRQEGLLAIKSHVLDMQGSPAANGSWNADLCDNCFTVITSVINTAFAHRKSTKERT